MCILKISENNKILKFTDRHTCIMVYPPCFGSYALIAFLNSLFKERKIINIFSMLDNFLIEC